MKFTFLFSKEVIYEVLMSSLVSFLISWYYNKRKEINNYKALCYEERKEILKELRMIFPYEDIIVNPELSENPLKLNKYRSDIETLKLKSKRVFPKKDYLAIFDLLEKIEEALSKENFEDQGAFIFDYKLGSLINTVRFLDGKKDIKDYYYLIVSKRLEETINLINSPCVLCHSLELINEKYYQYKIKKREKELIEKRKNYDNVGSFTL